MKKTYKKIFILVICLLFLFCGLAIVIKTPMGKLFVFNCIDFVQNQMEEDNKILLPTNNDEYQIEYANAKSPILLESYVGNNQIVHPKVLYFSDEFGGHSYWMAYTPYPWYISQFENPCIAYSDDGIIWQNIPCNPIDDPKGDGYDSDTHLVFCEEMNTLECWYRYVSDYGKPPVKEVLARRVSKDGIHWSEEQIIMENTTGDYARFLSPAVLCDDSGYKMWVVSDHGGYHIDYYESKNPFDFQFVRAIWLDYKYPKEDTNYRPWHIDVINEEGKYIYLVMCKEIKGSGPRRWDLFLTTSFDNETIEVPHMVIHGAEKSWDKYIYRSSIVKIGQIFRIYYSGLNSLGKHGIGISESTSLDGFIGK